MQTLDVLIVGAGPAGLGCATALKQCGVKNFLIAERDEIGAAFDRWPKQMRTITPSFHSNPFNQPDLNAISPRTSPADYLGTEHIPGPKYASYLRALAAHYELPVQTGIDVRSIKKKGKVFEVRTNERPLRARFIIWAAGEFFYPDDGGIQGADLCIHNSQFTDWTELDGDEFAIVGGYESGIDAAVHLAWAGKSVHILSRGEPWGADSPDPSRALSPITRDRLKTALLEAPGSFRFYKNADIAKVERIGNDYVLYDVHNEPFEIPTRPILATGFRGSLRLVEEHFTDEKGKLSFTEEADESPHTPGLFYSGPGLQHRNSLFCFIYKYRARFGIVTRAIASRLGLEWEEPLKAWRDCGFMVEDLDCCTDCQCAVDSEEAADPAPVEDYQLTT